MLQHPFYITNVHNRIIGNAASGVWNGFAFLSSKPPLGAHKGVNLRLSSRVLLEIDGNTAPKGTMQQDFILEGRYILPINAGSVVTAVKNTSQKKSYSEKNRRDSRIHGPSPSAGFMSKGIMRVVKK